SSTHPAARQSDPRHLRRPRLLRRLVPAGPGEPGPFLREKRRRHLAAQPQSLVARNRRQPDADPRRHRRANRRAPRQLLRRHPPRPAALRYRRRTLLASLLRPTSESAQAQRQTIPLHRHTEQTDQLPERSQRSSETTAARGLRREAEWRWSVGRQEVSVLAVDVLRAFLLKKRISCSTPKSPHSSDSERNPLLALCECDLPPLR